MADFRDLPSQTPRPVNRRNLPGNKTRRVYEALRNEIRRGDLPPGHVFTYLEQAAIHATTRDVVARAVRLLKADGLVETRRGAGVRIVIEGQSWEPPKDRASQVVHIERVMRERLADRKYMPGTRVPTLVTLGEEFRVTSGLVITAIAPLFNEGYLTAPRRLEGTKVTPLVQQVSAADLLRLATRPKYDPDAMHSAWGDAKTLREWSEPRPALRRSSGNAEEADLQPRLAGHHGPYHSASEVTWPVRHPGNTRSATAELPYSSGSPGSPFPNAPECQWFKDERRQVFCPAVLLSSRTRTTRRSCAEVSWPSIPRPSCTAVLTATWAPDSLHAGELAAKALAYLRFASVERAAS
ncbi:GntR family transcriptional regulator [Streptomyces sp. NPDC101455]|uniref:GntR family transcriptional regulator n=1 Tax=Streptomyces sp. NPDC101455 TaxID=3366142 RepID=UPI00380D91A9